MATRPDPSTPPDAARARSEGARPSIGRRGLLGGVGLLIGGAGALAGVPQVDAAPSARPAGPPGAEAGDLNEHRRTYYRLARF